MANKRPTSLTPEKREQFLACLAEGGTVKTAAELVNVTRETAYDARSKDKAFREAWETAYQQGADVLEKAAFERATAGASYQVLSKKGELVTVQSPPSDLLLIFLLKGKRPNVYREKAQLELSGAVGVRFVNDWRNDE